MKSLRESPCLRFSPSPCHSVSPSLREVFRHRVANFLHEGGEVPVVESGGGDWRVDVHEDGAGAEDEGVAGQDLSRPRDCDGDDRQSGLNSKLEAALLE